MVYVHDGVAHVRARNGLDLTAYFPELGKIAERTRAQEAILDGEIVAINGDGQPAFDLLRSRLSMVAQAVGTPADATPDLPLEFRLKKVAGQVSFQAYDILWLDGRSLLERPLWQRKNRLHDVIGAGPEFAAVDFVDDEGIAFYEAVVSRRLEGVVAKQKASVYTPGRRSRSWLQVRSLHSGDFVIGGYAFGGTRRKGDAFSQLMLGGYAPDGRLEYVGSVSGGMDDVEARDLVGMLESVVVEEPPFDDPPPIHRLIYWTQPKLVCHVRFSEWSPDGYLRFPIFSALRPDLDPRHCTID
jgi:ATP-dependent DNA ligase